MGKIIYLLMSITLALSASIALADDMRCCVEPKRNASGKIVRSKAVRLEFEKLYPLPAGSNRDDWHVDHVIPLANGGVDKIINMQWLPKKIKTCAEDYCKDRFERIIYKTR